MKIVILGRFSLFLIPENCIIKAMNYEIKSNRLLSHVTTIYFIGLIYLLYLTHTYLDYIHMSE